jgi:predicted PurR-regulated permease PerM
MESDERPHPGRALRMASDYGWRLLVLAGAGYVAVRVLSPVFDVVIAVVVALFITALLRPVLSLLVRHRVPRGIATALSVLFAFVVVGGILTYVIVRGVQDFPALGHQIGRIIPHVKHWLITGPLHVHASSVNNVSNTISKEASKNSGLIASSALSTGKTVLTLLAGFILAIFVTIFLLYDGEGVWGFLVRLFPREAHSRIDAAGRAVWRTLSNYIRGTLVVAAFHGVVIAVTLVILGVPLVAPLALVVALGAFVPLIGAIVAGALAVAVAGITHGIVGVVVILAVLLVDNQIEAHVLQPFVVGRYVRIHPLATVLALASGELLLGIFGAIIAVPTVACLNAGARCLVGNPIPPVDVPLGEGLSAGAGASAGGGGSADGGSAGGGSAGGGEGSAGGSDGVDGVDGGVEPAGEDGGAGGVEPAGEDGGAGGVEPAGEETDVPGDGLPSAAN